jgi:hypothetical protein
MLQPLAYAHDMADDDEGQRPRTITLGVRVEPEVLERLDTLMEGAEFPTTRAGVAKRALMRGLELLEAEARTKRKKK